MAVTFSELKSAYLSSAVDHGQKEEDQVVKNHLAALNRFMEYLDVSEHDSAEELFLSKWEKQKTAYYEYLREIEELAQGTAKNYVSLCNNICEVGTKILASTVLNGKNFTEILQQGIAARELRVTQQSRVTLL